MIFLINILEKKSLNTNQQTTKRLEKLPIGKELINGKVLLELTRKQK